MASSRRVFPYILTLLALLLLVPVGRAEADEWLAPGEETVSSEGSDADGGALLDGYVGGLFGMPTAQRRLLRSAQVPTGVNKVLYDHLAAKIQDIAAGRLTRTDNIPVSLSLSELGLRKYEWSASDLGVGSIVVNNTVTSESIAAVQRLTGYDIALVMACLRADHPYELYWYDISRGYTYTYPGQVISKNGVWYYSFENCSMCFSFNVSQDFAVKGTDNSGNPVYYNYRMDPSQVQAAIRAVNNAKGIVASCTGLSNYAKLNSYRQEICDLTSYNHDAWNNGQAQWPYGNPWQLVWVFDGDPSTRVVCEGYARAFQYLCDQSSFKGDLSCITVSGTLDDGKGPEGHAWNIVHMNDGLNYLVDVTVCDSAGLTEGDWLFMAGYNSNPSTRQYVYRCRGQSFTYLYDTGMSGVFSAAALQLSPTPFIPTAVGVSINSTNFPDNAFRSYIAQEIDWDGDGALSAQEIRRTWYIDVSDMGITTLKGVEYLTGLYTLECSGNPLTELDLSGLPLLESLNCNECSLASLYVGGNPELDSLSCWGNQLTSLPLRKNLALEYLNCSDNHLLNLDLSKNSALQYLYCEENRLTYLTVTWNPKLYILGCSENRLKSLNLTQNAKLTSLSCYHNQLSSLNVRRNTRLSRLICQGNLLTALDLANCPSLVAIASQSGFNPTYSQELSYDKGVAVSLRDNILRLPAQLKYVDAYTFQGIAADVIEIPAGCSLIFANAFADCPNLKEVRFDAACATDIHADAFGGTQPVIVTASPYIQAWAEENGLTWALE